MKKIFQYLFKVVYVILLPLTALYLIIEARNFDKTLTSNFGFITLLVLLFLALLFNAYVMYNNVLKTIKFKKPSWIEFGPVIGFSIGWGSGNLYIILPFTILTIKMQNNN